MDIKAFERDLSLIRQLHEDQRAFNSVNALIALGEELELVTTSTRKNVDKLRDQLRKEWPKSPLLFNGSLFRPLGIESKEVPLTRALAWWLGHGQSGSELARQSLAVVLKLVLELPEISNNDLQTWQVTAEHIPGSDRLSGRIDVFIHGYLADKKICIAIEAKINAREGINQWSKYAKALNKYYSKWEHHLVFLTQNGDKPNSMGESKSNVQTLTYGSLLEVLLPIFAKFDDQSEHASEFGRLLLADIARLCGVHISSQFANVFQTEHILAAPLEIRG